MTDTNRNLQLRGIALICAFFIIAGSAFAQGSLTAAQVAQKAAAVITGSKGLTATFTISSKGMKSKGSIKSDGNKFSVSMPEVSTWYNGTSLYTYNPRTSETTVVKPTARELAESNPLMYVKGGGEGYTYAYSNESHKGKYIIDLIPKNVKSSLRKLTFTINSSDYHIEKIKVITSSGETYVDVTSMKNNQVIPSGDFEYPKSKYPKAEIVDLR